jgi:single-stranded-DNA-specific exonuclease
MPSGPDGFVSDPRYSQEFERARSLLLGHPGRWRVIYHYDADGIASASSALRALARLGYPAQATALQGVERDRMAGLMGRTTTPVLVVDTGASWLDVFGRQPRPVVVLDHHRYPALGEAVELPDHVALVNPLDWGVDGMSEMCASTLTWLFTVFLDPVNWDNAPWGLSGAIGDRQHVGGFRGLNARLLEEAVLRSVLVRRAGLSLFGPSLADAIARSIDPYFRGLSGHPEASSEFVRRLELDPTIPPSRLSAEGSARLAKALKTRLAEAHVLPEFAGVLDQERWFVPALGLDAEEISNLQNATGRAGQPGVGVALALGDRGAMERARFAEATWRGGILAGLQRVEEGGVNSMRNLSWFESPDTTLAGTQAGLSMNYLLPPERPVFVFTASVGGSIKVSARGTTRLVDHGLDLATACRLAAAEVGGEGGGHRVAAGATIPTGRRDDFLAAADRQLGPQLGGAPRGAA